MAGRRRRRGRAHAVRAPCEPRPVAPPHARPARRRARPLGADTAAVLAELVRRPSDRRRSLRDAEVGGVVVDVGDRHGRITTSGRRAGRRAIDIDAGGRGAPPRPPRPPHPPAGAGRGTGARCRWDRRRSPVTPSTRPRLRAAADAAAPGGVAASRRLPRVGRRTARPPPTRRPRGRSPGAGPTPQRRAVGANTAALAATGDRGAPTDPGVVRDDTGRATGRLFGLDAVVRDRTVGAAPDVAAVGRELAGYGVIGVDRSDADRRRRRDRAAGPEGARTDVPRRRARDRWPGPRCPDAAPGLSADRSSSSSPTTGCRPSTSWSPASARPTASAGPSLSTASHAPRCVLALAAWHDAGSARRATASSTAR